MVDKNINIDEYNFYDTFTSFDKEINNYLKIWSLILKKDIIYFKTWYESIYQIWKIS